MQTDTQSLYFHRGGVRNGAEAMSVRDRSPDFLRHPHSEPGARLAAELTVVVPTYSERDNVAEVVRRMYFNLDGLNL